MSCPWTRGVRIDNPALPFLWSGRGHRLNGLDYRVQERVKQSMRFVDEELFLRLPLEQERQPEAGATG